MTSTERKWLERVREWRESGQSAEDFSVGRGFAANSLRQWSSLLRRRGLQEAPVVPTKIRFALVERDQAVTAPATITIELGDVRVRIPPGADASTVRSVLVALRSSDSGSR